MFESYAPYKLKTHMDSSNPFFVVKLTNVNYGVNTMKLKMRLKNQLSVR